MVPQAAKIDVSLDDTQDGGNKVNAGDEVKVDLQALAVNDEKAVTYDMPATLTIGGGMGIDLLEDKSRGATDNGDGTISLNGEDWVVGKANGRLSRYRRHRPAHYHHRRGRRFHRGWSGRFGNGSPA